MAIPTVSNELALQMSNPAAPTAWAALCEASSIDSLVDMVSSSTCAVPSATAAAGASSQPQPALLSLSDSVSLSAPSPAAQPTPVSPKRPSPLRRMVSAQDLLPRLPSRAPSTGSLFATDSGSPTLVSACVSHTGSEATLALSPSSGTPSSASIEPSEDDPDDDADYYDMYYSFHEVTTYVGFSAAQQQQRDRRSALRVVSESLRKLVSLGEENVEEDMQKRLTTMAVLRTTIDALSESEREDLVDTLDWADAQAQFDEPITGFCPLLYSLPTLAV